MKICLSKKIILLVTAVTVLFISLPFCAYAAVNNSGEITVKYIAENVEFRLYKIGKTENGQIILNDKFSGYSVDMSSKNAAETLAQYIKRDSINTDVTECTDNTKNVVFNNVSDGAYLVTAEDVTINSNKYKAVPFFVYMPGQDGNYNVNVEGKFYTTPEYNKVSVTKKWLDVVDKSKVVPIEVQLLRNGEVYDTKTLNDENSWYYEWTGLDKNSEWTVLEKSVPQKFYVTINADGNAYIMVNRFQEIIFTVPNTGVIETLPSIDATSTSSVSSSEPSTVDVTRYSSPTENASNNTTSTSPNTPYLPQTGQLWWPVSVLSLLGIVLIVVGIILRKKNDVEK